MVSIHPRCAVLNGGGVYCCRSTQSTVCGLCHLLPVRTVRVLRSCHALSVARCVVCAVRVCLYSFVWWGILQSLPPRSGGGWGCRGWWGGIVVVGWHGDGRAAVSLSSPSACWRSPSVCMVAVLNGGSGVCVMSRVGVGAGTCIVLLPSCIIPPLGVFVVTPLLV